MPENKKPETENKNDTLAFIIGGIFILGLVFATYNYFTGKGNGDFTSDDQERRLSIDELKEALSTNTEEDERMKEEVAGTTEISDETVMSWTANDYEEGDVKPGTYSVISGDTLWEIAEAVYGDGTMWTEILDANSDSVGFLPNGQQSLILVGQTLTIPTR